jgi:predicted MPP superfamily phosphohydrolase
MTFFLKTHILDPMNTNTHRSGSKLGPVANLWQILLVLAIILTVFGFVHWFMYLTVVRSLAEDASVRMGLVAIYSVGLFAMPLGFLVSRNENNKLILLTWFGYIWMGFFAIHLFYSLVEFILSLIIQHPFSYWVLVASFVTSLWALYKGMKFPVIVQHSIVGPEPIQKFKLAQISDLHVGMLHLNEAWLEKVVSKINEQNPDIIAITGDLAEGHFHQISKMLEPLKNLKAPHGVYYITGNHEYIHPGEWELHLKGLGITPLHNENKTIEFNKHKIMIAGVPDKMAPRFRRELVSKPDHALSSTEDYIYKILLAHQPSSVFDIKNENCDLMIAGHTHGGQIFPFHLGVLLQQPMVSGFKKFGKTLVFNHQGTGFWGPPMRWFSRSEIVTIEIK